MNDRVYRGIRYHWKALPDNTTNTGVFEGGAVGGDIFANRDGCFGHLGSWHPTFEAAADRQREINRKGYETRKKHVVAYENQLANEEQG